MPPTPPSLSAAPNSVPWTIPRPLAGLPPVLLFFLISTASRAGQPEGYPEAVALYQARQYSEAQQAFSRVARTNPGDVEVNFHLGRLALWFDDAPTALEHLERAHRAAPNDARVWNALGDTYGLQAQKAALLAKLGWARRCRAAYERAVELDPACAAYRWSLLAFYQLAPRLVGGSEDKARRESEVISRLDPAAGRVARATLHLAAHEADRAFAEFDAVLREHPDDFIALYQVGRCADVSGEQLDRGLRALQRCLDLPSPIGEAAPRKVHVLSRLAGILERQGDAKGAQAAREQAARLEPDFRLDKDTLKN
jgi:tetratricopeptide (TPR) repeat protein